MRTKFGFAAAFALALTTAAASVELNVTHFGTGMYGVPYAIAREKGYFKEIGLDVTGFLTSAGGGTANPSWQCRMSGDARRLSLFQ